MFLPRRLDHNWLYDRYFVTKLPAVWIKRNRYLGEKRDSSSSSLSFSPLLLSIAPLRRQSPVAVVLWTRSPSCGETKCRSKPDSLTCRDDGRWLIRDWSLRVIRRSTIRKLPTHRVIAATCFETKWPCSLLSILLPHDVFPSHFLVDSIPSFLASCPSFCPPCPLLFHLLRLKAKGR